jgi:hypothetical protein
MLRKSFRTNRWVASDPVVVYRLLRGFFRALVLRRNTLRVIQVFPTFECQARCEMCSVARFRGRRKDVLTLEEYGSIAAQGARMGAVAATLLGGEPLLVRDVEDIIRTFKRRHFYVSIVSNGIACTRRGSIRSTSAWRAWTRRPTTGGGALPARPAAFWRPSASARRRAWTSASAPSFSPERRSAAASWRSTPRSTACA